jgi:hypothetical protein
MPSASLSTQGLARAASISEPDFAFIGNNGQLQCTKFQAAFISPRVHTLLQEDKTMDFLFVECPGGNSDEERMFEFLEDLMNGLEIRLSESDVDDYLRVAAFLGNTEFLDLFLAENGPVEQSNVCSRLRRKSAVGRPVEDEIEFAASHFYELDLKELKGVEVSVLERIVSSPGLRLESEDSLLDFICSFDLAEEIVLLRYLRSEYLSIDGMSVLLDRLPDSDLDCLIWSSLCRRLRLPVSLQTGKWNQGDPSVLSRFVNPEAVLGVANRRGRISEIPIKEAKSLDGIISYLTLKYGGNVHEKGIVKLTSKSVYNDNAERLTTAADLTSGLYFCSKNRPGQWVCWDFGEMRIRVTHYTIKTNQLRSWVVEGSSDGQTWTEVDLQREVMDLRREGRGSFRVWNPAEFRLIRLTQTETNAGGDDFLFLTAVEFFGELSE